MIRNLFYQICPIAHNDEWKFNIECLKKKIHIFNGRLIFIIKTGSLMVAKDEVLDYLEAPENSIIIYMENDPNLAEANGFFKGLDLLKSLDENEITFYAHTKGVSPNYLEEDRSIIREWSSFMYEFNLNDVETVDRILKQYDCYGTLKLRGAHKHLPVPWHYSGSFYWFRHDKVFGSPKYDTLLPKSYFSSEAFLGFLIKDEDAFCIAGENCKNLYKLSSEDWEVMRKES